MSAKKVARPACLDARPRLLSLHPSTARLHEADAPFGVIFFMKKLCLLFIFAALTAPALAQSPQLKDEKDKVSYSIGLDIGNSFKKQGIASEVNPDLMAAGLKDAINGNKPLMTEAEMKDTLIAFQKTAVEKQANAAKEAANKNASEGEKFLAENKGKEGVKTTASGLQYKVMKEGSGESPKETDTVVTHYRGTLINGTEFDSSYKRNEPATFPVNRVIKGWTEALQLMKPGSKYQLFIPASLAYGERGAGQDIGPNETLIFEVELLSVESSKPKLASPAVAPSVSPSPEKPKDPKPKDK